MAFKLPSFNLGPDYADMDIETLRKKRQQIADAMASTGQPRTAIEGLGKIGLALMARHQSGKLDARAGQLRSEYDSKRDKILEAMGFGFDPVSVSTDAISSGAGVTTTVGSQGADDLSVMPSTAHGGDHSGHGHSDGSYINYANQSATRNRPISDRLANAMGFLDDMGVQMEVFSGGQAAKGSGGPRVGSTRHDHGNAADVYFSKDGRRLDWAIPQDRPVFQDIVRQARANGITGIGAGDGYMRPGSMHIGFGNEAVWGAGGKSANAPAWLRDAFYSSDAAQAQAPVAPRQNPALSPAQRPMQAPVQAPVQVALDTLSGGAGSSATMIGDQGQDSLTGDDLGGAQAPAQVPAEVAPQAPVQAPQQARSASPQARQNVAALLSLLGDPMASDQDRQLFGILLQREFAANAPMSESQKLDLELKRLQLDQARNPTVSPIEVNGQLINPRTGEVLGDYRTPENTKPIEINGQLVDPRTGQVLGDYRTPETPDTPTSVQEYNFYVAQEQAAGRTPMGYAEWQNPVEPGYRQLSPEEIVKKGLNPQEAWQVAPDGQISKIGGGGVTVNTGDQETEFQKSTGKALAENAAGIVETGQAARRNLGDIDTLAALIETTPQGLMGGLQGFASAWGLGELTGAQDVETLNAVISRLVPAQRQPGSGTMSDRDLELFKMALPRLLNSVDGNRQIVGTLRAIANYDVARADIYSRLQMGQIDPQMARELEAQLPNPVPEFIRKGQVPAGQAPAQAQAPVQAQSQVQVPVQAPVQAPVQPPVRAPVAGGRGGTHQRRAVDPAKEAFLTDPGVIDAARKAGVTPDQMWQQRQLLGVTNQ